MCTLRACLARCFRLPPTAKRHTHTPCQQNAARRSGASLVAHGRHPQRAATDANAPHWQRRQALCSAGMQQALQTQACKTQCALRNTQWLLTDAAPDTNPRRDDGQTARRAWLITKPPCSAWQARALSSDRTGFSARRANGLLAYRSIGLVYQLICQMDLSNGSVNRPACARRPGFRNRPARSKTVGSHAPKRGWPAARSLAHGRFATRWRRHCPQATHWS